jgi:hypothetical protein
LPRAGDDTAQTADEYSDVVHDLLVHLANQMISANSHRLEVQHMWRECMETVVPNADKLTKEFRGGGWVDIGFQDGWDGIKAVFQAKGVAPPSGTLRDLRRETEDALNKLRPLCKRIEATNRLIDQIVYRLYGLTEDQISVVEESVKGS